MSSKNFTAEYNMHVSVHGQGICVEFQIVHFEFLTGICIFYYKNGKFESS